MTFLKYLKLIVFTLSMLTIVPSATLAHTDHRPETKYQIIGQQVFPLNYWNSKMGIYFNGTDVYSVVSKYINPSISSKALAYHKLTSTGIKTQWTEFMKTTPNTVTFLNGEMIYLGDNSPLIYKENEELFRLYGSGETLQAATDSQGFIYVYTDVRKGHNDSKKPILQIVNTNGIFGDWELTHTFEQTLKFPGRLADSDENYFQVNDHYLALINLRQDKIDIYDINDRYQPKLINSFEKPGSWEMKKFLPILIGKNLVTQNGQTLELTNILNGEVISKLNLPEHAYSGHFDGQSLYVGGKFKVYRVDLDRNNLRLSKQIRVTYPESAGVTHIHRTGNFIYAVWKNRDYGNATNRGFSMTTIEILK